MKKLTSVLAVLVGLAIVASIPIATLAQTTQPVGPASVNGSQSSQGVRQVPQPKGGVATVIGVDQPDNCLRIRSGPGSEYEVVGCAAMGEQLNITGVWTSNDWAQLADNGWVYGPQIQTDLRPPSTAYSQPPQYSVIEGVSPDDYEVYPDTYLPDYGYTTYWYGGAPIFLYGLNVWHRYHPWWAHRGWYRGHRVWDRHRGFNTYTRTRANLRSGTRVRPGAYLGTGTRRNFITNRPGVASRTVPGFGPSRFRSGFMNRGRTFRSFSAPNAGRLGSSGFRRAAPLTGGSRIGGASRFSGPHFSGGAARIGGGGRRR